MANLRRHITLVQAIRWLEASGYKSVIIVSQYLVSGLTPTGERFRVDIREYAPEDTLLIDTRLRTGVS